MSTAIPDGDRPLHNPNDTSSMHAGATQKDRTAHHSISSQGASILKGTSHTTIHTHPTLHVSTVPTPPTVPDQDAIDAAFFDDDSVRTAHFVVKWSFCFEAVLTQSSLSRWPNSKFPFTKSQW